MFSGLTKILRCPITHTALIWLEERQIADLNQQIKQEGIFHLDLTPVTEPLTAAFRSSDERFIYPVEEGIISLLPQLAVTQDIQTAREFNQMLGIEKRSVKEFYDEVGWKTAPEGAFIDAARFEDLRSVSQEYIHNCHLRVNHFLPEKGTFLLDAASGPIQYAEYLTYSDGYQYRICADFSRTALKEARKRIGDKGIYLLCDVSNLPLQDQTMDGMVSLHTVYHLPADEQLNAVQEFYRVLKNGSRGVIVYSWGGHSIMMKLFTGPYVFLKRIFSGKKTEEPSALFYYHHDFTWYKRHIQDQYNTQLRVWRSVSVSFLRRVIHERFLGKQILAFLYNLENTFPYFFGRYGLYPIFIIRKE